MEISDLDFYLVEIERTEPGEPIRAVLIRVASDDGLEGWGEASMPWQAEELSARRNALLPVLAGRSIFDVEELHTLSSLRHPALRAGLEMALLDLIGRACGQPLCRLLGGSYRRWIPLAVRLRHDSPQRLAQLARELADQGFQSQIVSAGGRPEHDLRTLRAVREGLGGRAELRFDGMARYAPETARDLCAELEYEGLQFFADPLHASELYTIASLARQTNVPLAVGRAIRGPADVLAAIRCGAAGFVIVDLSRVGGIIPARKCAAVAEAGRIEVVLGGSPSLGIATAAAAGLVAATPVLASCNESAYHQLRDDVLAEPLELADGMIALPQGPGLGVEVDRAKVERYQVT